jgi:hypothetical protein
MARILQFVKQKEWVMFVAFILAVLASVQSNASILPDDVEGYVIGPVILVQGWLIRLKVWAEANLP